MPTQRIAICVLLVVGATGAVILTLHLYPHHGSVREFVLKNGEQVNVDFGFPPVSAEDFKAESEIILKNTKQKPVKITKVSKSCSCQSLTLDPKDVVLPGQGLSVRFVHSNATNGKGGYFNDRILLQISDGDDTGEVRLTYSGFVNKASHTFPDKIYFRNLRPGSKSSTEKGFVFLSRLVTSAGKCVLSPPHKILSVRAPEGVTVQLIDAQERPELSAICPRTQLPNIKSLESGKITDTQKELRRFFATSGPDVPPAIWQPFLLVVRAENVSDSVKDSICIRTNRTTIRIPVEVQLMPDLTVQPKSIALSAKSGTRAAIDVRSNTQRPLKISSLNSDSPFLALKAEEVSPMQSRVIVDVVDTENIKDNIKARILINTNSGSIEVPYLLVVN